VLDNFDRISKERNGSAFLTDRQRQWVQAHNISSRITLNTRHCPVLPAHAWNSTKKVHKMVQSRRFEVFIMACIVINVILMACEYYRMDQQLLTVLFGAEVIFLSIFTLEAIFKIWAWGYVFYFSDRWNQFDFFIVLASYCLLLPLSKLGVNVNVLRIFRFSRVLRFVRLIKFYSRLRMLMKTLSASIPALWNIGLLLFIQIFVFTIFGMRLFGPYDCDVTDTPCEGDAVHANFSNFIIGANLLYRVATSDGWTVIYERYLHLMENKRWLVHIYFISFFFLGTLVLLNLFIGFVLEAFGDNQELSKMDGILEPIRQWRDVWERFDSNANGQILADQFVETLIESPPPVGLRKPTSTQSITAGEIYLYLSEMYLLTRRHVDELSVGTLDNMIGMFSNTFRSEEEALRENIVTETWTVDFDSAALALATKILMDNEYLQVKLVVEPDENEKPIAEWFRDDNPGDFELTFQRFSDGDNFSGGGSLPPTMRDATSRYYGSSL